jgi:AcrR family transcriptional regulator
MNEPSPAHGRRAATTGKGSQRRTTLLDAAESILSESGYRELTMRAVATAANVRLGHLQYYFPSHTDLITAVLRRSLDRSLEKLAPLFNGAAEHTPPDAEGLIRRLLTEHEDPRLVRVYAELWALAARDETTAAALRAFYHDYQDHAARFIRANGPSLPEDVCRARAAVFTMLIEGAALFRSGLAGHRTEATDAELVTTAAALLGGESG